MNDCYDKKYPNCVRIMDTIIRPVVRIGLMAFLAESFGDNYSGLVTPVQLAKQLFDFKNAGSLVYKRSKSHKAESIRITQLTIMQ